MSRFSEILPYLAASPSGNQSSTNYEVRKNFNLTTNGTYTYHTRDTEGNQTPQPTPEIIEVKQGSEISFQENEIAIFVYHKGQIHPSNVWKIPEISIQFINPL